MGVSDIRVSVGCGCAVCLDVFGPVCNCHRALDEDFCLCIVVDKRRTESWWEAKSIETELGSNMNSHEESAMRVAACSAFSSALMI